MSYEELQKKMNWVTFADVADPAPTLVAEVAPVQQPVMEVQPAPSVHVTTVSSAPVQNAVAQPAQPASNKTSSLDDLLNGLV